MATSIFVLGKRFLLVATLSLGLAGCAIYRDVPYIAPAAAPGIKIHNTFRGLPEYVEFFADEKGSLSLGFLWSNQIQVDQTARYMLRVGDGDSFQLQDSELTMTSLPGGEKVKLKIEKIKAQEVVDGIGKYIYLSPEARLEGQTYTYKKAFGGTDSMRRSFLIDVVIPGSIPDHFTLQLPLISRSGVSVQFPAVEFRRAVGSAYQGAPP